MKGSVEGEVRPWMLKQAQHDDLHVMNFRFR